MYRHRTVGPFGLAGSFSWTPDVVEDKNLNRILNTTAEDVRKATPKVEVAARFIRRLELGQIVLPLQKNMMDRSVVHQVAACDMVFGCMDGVEGRHLLNRLATFYNLPYFDVGIRLDADGSGGIDKIVNEMLARFHAYRIQPNGDYSQISPDLTDPHLYFEGENEDCELLRRHVGRGDAEPPLEMPALS
jgi:hypothetical protein